jgi:uncharacterized protein (DUF488 family)
VKEGKRRRQTTLTGGSRLPTLHTCGYSGHTPASYAALVKAAGVEQVLDVRSFPYSRKPGFSKKALEAFLRNQGIGYVHIPELGAPRALLTKKKAGSTMAQIAPAYRRHLAGQGAALEESMARARDRPSVLLCLEKDPKECHRGILAQRFAKKGFRVLHL